MEFVSSPLGMGVIAGVVALLIVLAVLHFRFHVFRRRKHRMRSRPAGLGSGRIEVLETSVIDAERRLVLVRCDQIEHLIVVGGPNDVVVENDVRKARGPSSPTAKAITIEPSKLTASSSRVGPAQAAGAAIAPPPATVEQRPVHRPPESRTAAPAARAPAAASPPPGRNAPAAARTDDRGASRSAGQRPSDALGRRDPAPLRMPPAHNGAAQPSRAPEPLRSQSGAPAADRSGRTARPGARTTEPSVSLPAAQIPWSDPDSIENEIVRALRFDPQTRPGAGPARREPAPVKPPIESSATLGDIADRLEEALAREMQAGGSATKPSVDLEDFSFDSGPEPAVERAPPQPAPKERVERRERSEPPKATIAAAPEPEQRREAPAQPERREETPVISLNSRRREAADPLEDEMARLLGELTSDNKGR